MEGTLVFDKKPKAVWMEGSILRVGSTKGDAKAKSFDCTEAVELTRVPSVSPPFGFQFRVGKNVSCFYATDTSECSTWMKTLASVGAKPSAVLAERILDVSGQAISKFPKPYLEKQGLTTLIMSSNALTKLPEDFGCFAKLETLDLSSNQLKALPDAFGFLASLKTLNLAENLLTDLPITFGRLTTLTSLTVSNNKLTQLPPCVFSLVELDTFNISYNPFTKSTLPDTIANLTLLKNLDLSGCGLTAIPDAITALVALRVLEIFRNRLTSLPTQLANLKLLSRLNVGRNKITILPELPPHLTELDITSNPINDLPNSVGVLQAFIEYAECPLSAIPEGHKASLAALKAFLVSRKQ
jgi:Leucine-rich repeat (LRR) protein